MPIRHVVVFTFRPGTSPEQVAELKRRLEELPAVVPQIRAYQVGPDATDGTDNYDFAVTGEFDSLDDFEEAIRSLALLDHPSLKGLLRRVVGKVFNDVEIKGWCKEQEQRNASARLAEIARPQAASAAA